MGREMLDRSKITDTARVRCSWDMHGQYVDLDYDYNVEQDIVENYALIFAELYEDGNPNDETWDEALKMGKSLAEMLDLPLVVDDFRTKKQRKWDN